MEKKDARSFSFCVCLGHTYYQEGYVFGWCVGNQVTAQDQIAPTSPPIFAAWSEALK